MKLLAKISLRWRVTLLTGVLLALCSLSITMFSIYNAGKTYVPAMHTLTVAVTPTLASEVQSVDEAPYSSVKEEKIPDQINSPEDIGEVLSGEAVPQVNDVSETTVHDEAQGQEGMSTAMRIIPAAQVTRTFNQSSFLFFGIFTAFGMIAVYFIMGRALKPVGKLSRGISEITAHNLSATLPQVQTNDEISQLTESFNQMLERLNGAFAQQKRFTSSAAHELKTPLATMKASIQVLNMDETPSLADYQENNQILEASVDRLSTMVDQLLLLAWEREDEELREKIFLRDMVESIQKEVSQIYKEKEITWEILGCEVSLFGNESLLYRGIYNLIENAYKYNRDKGHVFAAMEEDATGVSLKITDTGMGIPAVDVPMIFEAFYRGDPSRSSEIPGSGLGLSITKSIFDKIGARVQVESTPGVGTCFTVIFEK